MSEVGIWRRLYRIIRANVNHYRFAWKNRPRKVVKPIPIKVKSKPWVRPATVFIQPPRHYLDSLQEARRLEIKAASKLSGRLSDILADDICTYQRAANRASIATNDPHNYYHRER